MNGNKESKWQRPKDTYKKMELEKKTEEKSYSKEEWEEIFTKEKEENRVQTEHQWRENINKKSTVKDEESKETKLIKTTTKSLITVLIVWYVVSTMSSNYLHNKQIENFKKEMEITNKTLDNTFSNTLNKLTTNLKQQTSFKKQRSSLSNANNKKPAKKWKRTYWEVRDGYGCINNRCTYKVIQHYQDCSLSTGKCHKQTRRVERNTNQISSMKITYL